VRGGKNRKKQAEDRGREGSGPCQKKRGLGTNKEPGKNKGTKRRGKQKNPEGKRQTIWRSQWEKRTRQKTRKPEPHCQPLQKPTSEQLRNREKDGKKDFEDEGVRSWEDTPSTRLGKKEKVTDNRVTSEENVQKGRRKRVTGRDQRKTGTWEEKIRGNKKKVSVGEARRKVGCPRSAKI